MRVTQFRTDPVHHEDPYTRHGVRVAPFAHSGLSAFAIHECGFLPNGNHSRLDHGRRRADWNFPGVRSPYWRLYYNHDWGSLVRFSKREISLGPDRVVIIPEDVLFDCVGEAGTSHLWMHFSPLRHAVASLAEPAIIPITAGLSAAIADLVTAHRAPRPEVGLQHLYHSASALIHASFAMLRMPLGRAYPDRLAAIVAHIDGNPGDDLANPRLAHDAAMSVETFIRWFKKHVKVTPAAYVTRSRVRAAARLLVLSERGIDDIAVETGFPNRYYLSRVFSAHMGCGPATFRRRHVRV
jgi:AraC family transcriptional regulator of arabinose operon